MQERVFEKLQRCEANCLISWTFFHFIFLDQRDCKNARQRGLRQSTPSRAQLAAHSHENTALAISHLFEPHVVQNLLQLLFFRLFLLH